MINQQLINRAIVKPAAPIYWGLRGRFWERSDIMGQLKEVKTVPILGIYGMIPVIHECSKCEHREECETQEYKDQGYCYIYKNKED